MESPDQLRLPPPLVATPIRRYLSLSPFHKPPEGPVIRAIVSLSVHEAELAIIDQCLNYRVVGGMDGIVLHATATAALDLGLVQSLIDRLPLLRGHVWINPERLSLFPMTGSPQHTPVLHRAHAANFAFMAGFDPFDVFCLDASNSLLVRRGLRRYIAAGDGVYGEPVMPPWPWVEAVRADPVAALYPEAVVRSHHEGTFFRRETFEVLAGAVRAYEDHLQSLGIGDEGLSPFPREEILLPTAYAALDPPRLAQSPYIWLPWERDLAWSPAEVAEVLATGVLLPGKFGIKRVPRDIDDPVRVAVGEHFGYRALLADAGVLSRRAG